MFVLHLIIEAVKKFKGRCIFKQYIKGKPVRWGIKIFCVCCSLTSYLFNAMFYVGKCEDDSNKEASVTHQTVVKLMQPLAGKNHGVYMDNYYTGIPLFRELEKMDILSTGTVRTNRKGLDKAVTMKKSEEKQLKKNLVQHAIAPMVIWCMQPGLIKDLCICCRTATHRLVMTL